MMSRKVRNCSNFGKDKKMFVNLVVNLMQSKNTILFRCKDFTSYTVKF